MKENVMSVSAGINVATIGIYEVDFSERDKINSVKVLEYVELSDLKVEEVSKVVQLKCKDNDVKHITVDCMGVSKAIADILFGVVNFEPKIYDCYPKSVFNNYDLLKLDGLIKSGNITTSKDVEIDFSKFKLVLINKSNSQNVRIEDTEYNNIFSSIILLVGYIEFSRKNQIVKDKKNKVDKNLTEILQILVDDLYKLNGLEKEKVDSLTRLIDKVNYLRGQYQSKE